MSAEIEHEVYEEPAEPEHVEAITGGLLDMLNGVESYNTRYTQAVLECAGYVTRREVAGNEGFFSTIGNGIKKVIEYIVNMFKSLWNWLTGGSSGGGSSGGGGGSASVVRKKAATEAASSLVAAAAIENGTLVKSQKDANAIAEVVKKKATRQAPAEKRKSEERVERIKKAPTPAEAIKAANDVAAEVYEEEVSQAELDAAELWSERVRLDNIESLLKQKIKYNDSAVEFIGFLEAEIDRNRQYIDEYESTLKGLQGDPKEMAKAVAVLTIDFCKKLEEGEKTLYYGLGRIKEHIKVLEDLKTASPDKITEDDKEAIEGLTMMLRATTMMAQFVSQALKASRKFDPSRQTLEDMLNSVELGKESFKKSFVNRDGSQMSGEQVQRFILTGRK